MLEPSPPASPTLPWPPRLTGLDAWPRPRLAWLPNSPLPPSACGPPRCTGSCQSQAVALLELSHLGGWLHCTGD
eukprot:5879378-Alexandrium_andersonii.AAC.1